MAGYGKNMNDPANWKLDFGGLYNNYRKPSDTFTKFEQYAIAACQKQNHIMDFRTRLEFVDLAYMREMDMTEEQAKARLKNKMRDPTKVQNIQIPLVMQMGENFVSFMNKVFCSNFPMIEMVASPEFEAAANGFNTLVEEDNIRFGWAQQMGMLFRNAFKYNIAPCEVSWEQMIRKVPSLSGSTVTGKQEVYSGNSIKTIDPYNFIYDPTVPMHKQHTDGEVIGYQEVLNRVSAVQWLNNLGDKRFKRDKEALECPPGSIGACYYVPRLNWDVLTTYEALLGNGLGSSDTNWYSWLDQSNRTRIEYKNVYYKTVLYARIFPKEFNIKGPASEIPQIWKLCYLNSCCVYAQPMKELHEYLPIMVGMNKVDGLNLQTKSNAEDANTFQQIASGLWNAKIASARRRTTDRVLYNPLLINPDHINSPNPSAKIPVNQAAFGRPLSEAVHQFPFHDENSQYFVSEANAVEGMAFALQGENNVSQGQFQKGNKLQDEFSAVMSNSGAVKQSAALNWEYVLMTPLKYVIKTNYLQFTQETKRYSRKLQQQINISPAQLFEMQGEFKVGDGLLDTQRQLRSDVFQQGMQTIFQVPQLGAEYNVADMWVYMMQTQGAKGLTDFKKSQPQITYEQAVGQWQQTVQMLMKQNPNVQQSQFPQQPKPQDYGYDPNATDPGQQNPTSKQQQPQQSGPAIAPTAGQPGVTA